MDQFISSIVPRKFHCLLMLRSTRMLQVFVADFLEAILRSVQSIPAELRPKFMEDVLKIYLEACPKSEEGLPVLAIDCLAVHAQRKD